MEKTTVQIDIVSDVVCPWCYVGKRNLEKAISQLGDDYEVRIEWHPFQLDPTIPAAGIERDVYFERKFGSRKAMENIFDHLRQVGVRAGIDFRLETMGKAINTLPLHALLQVAGQEGFQHELEETFFRAYFTEGIDLTKEEELVRLLSPWGWSAEKIQGILNDEDIQAQVGERIRYAQRMGINGVPFFILNEKYALSGAQPPEAFLQAIRETSAPPVPAEGDACDLDSGAC